jgi:hypothetical protein
MEIKDLNEEAIIKISFPDEDEIEDDTHRIFLGLISLKEYFLDFGLDPEEISDVMAFFCISRFCIESKDLEFARQRIRGFLDAGLERSLEEKKKLDDASDIHQADFFSVFFDPQDKTTIQ